MYPHINKDSDCRVPKTRVLIAYHAHCIDGFTSAWACWKGLIETTDTLSEDIELRAVQYNELIDIVARTYHYAKVYFVDFSIPVSTLLAMTKNNEVIIIDHHKTAVAMYEGHCDMKNATIVMDLSECGASLVWKHFFGSRKMPELIKFVRDYDLWQFKLNYTREINKFLRIQKQELYQWEAIWGYLEKTTDMLNAARQGEAIQAYHNQIVTDLVLQAESCEIKGEQGLVVNCSPHFASDVGHALEKLSGTFGATWQQEPKGVVKWSLRSSGDYDVSVIAAAFGGGGHKHAAGFTLAAPTDDVTKLGITLWNS